MIWNSNHHVVECYNLSTYYFLVLSSLPYVGQAEFLKPRSFSCFFGPLRSNSENAWPACVMLTPTKWLGYLWMNFRITLWWLFDNYMYKLALKWLGLFWNNFEMTSTCWVCSSCSERWIDVASIFICFLLNLVMTRLVQFYFEFSTS
jgi:hypothetical protein